MTELERMSIDRIIKETKKTASEWGAAVNGYADEQQIAFTLAVVDVNIMLNSIALELAELKENNND